MYITTPFRLTVEVYVTLMSDYEYIKKIRASYYLLGALLGKYKSAHRLHCQADVILEAVRLTSILKVLRHLVQKLRLKHGND